MTAELVALLGRTQEAPGREGAIETGSLCRWHGIDSPSWLLSDRIDAQAGRGLVVIAAELIGDELIRALPQARDRVLKKQNG